LIQNGANVNQPSGDGDTALAATCLNGNLAVVEYLINHGADVNQEAKDGATPLAFAMYNNQTQIAKLLLRKGANVESTKLFLMKCEFLDLIYILDKLCKEINE